MRPINIGSAVQSAARSLYSDIISARTIAINRVSANEYCVSATKKQQQRNKGAGEGLRRVLANQP